MKSKLIFTKISAAIFLSATGILLAQTYQGARQSTPATPVTIKGRESIASVQKTAINDTASADQMENRYKEEIIRLRKIRNSGSLDDLLAQGKQIENAWGNEGGKFYGLFWREFLSALTSKRFLENQSGVLDLSQNYVLKALQKADTFDYETEWRLLMFLRPSPTAVRLTAAEKAKRMGQSQLWLHLLRRLENEKDSAFNPADLPSLNVAPPDKANGLPGMAPENVKDVKLRDEYQKAIDENTRKIEHYTHQARLRQDEDFILKNAVKYIAEEYSRSSNDAPELNELLRNAKISETVKTRIISRQIELLSNK